MSCSTHHLTQHLLHIIAILLKIFLLWHIHGVLLRVIMCHSASVFAHRHQVVLHLLDEVIHLATQCLVFIRTDIRLHHLFIFFFVFQWQHGLVDVEQHSYFPIVDALVLCLIGSRQFLVVLSADNVFRIMTVHIFVPRIPVERHTSLMRHHRLVSLLGFTK